MKHYTQHDITLGKLRLKQGKGVEPELAAAILGEGITMTSAYGNGGVSVPAPVNDNKRHEALQRILTSARTQPILNEVAAERARQDARWGEQNHPDFLPDQFGGNAYDAERRAHYYGVPEEAKAKEWTEHRFRIGVGTYGDIFVEEVAEAIGAENEERLREELVQVAAVAVAWIEAIDRRKAKEAA